MANKRPTFLGKVILVLLTALSVSCARETKPPAAVYYATGSGLENVELIVNGNPTNEGRAISLFIISGINRIQLSGDVMDGGYMFRIGKSSKFLSSDYRDLVSIDEAKSGFRENRQFTFSESDWPRWSWQDADEITSFTPQDMDDIYSIILQSFEAAKRLESPLTPRTKPWTEDPASFSQANELSEKALKELKSYGSLIHELSPKKELTTAVGKQMVLVRTKDGEKIFYVGRAPKDIPEAKPNGPMVFNYYIGSKDMFFAKFNGKWTLLLPIP